ncbi:hypothetical protein FRB94_011745 [Tulasnella sp. JGI-2019a]|nr:hypothetical protein FRB93_010232 [Tulasnella sp. JGI-2019a]KAG8992259.1 hypothetical protein FRB94_011745 [Tulasnella sp. JGI-2019a]KAG9022518.1 hypothetical protein FRB95_014672 [Tulasnella sp. JGI-2019a]
MTSNKCKVNDDGDRDYVDIQDHGLIGNLHTAALISIDGSVESYCVPDFDSPSVFARILDKDKGGHFSVMPQDLKGFQSKQAYLPSSNILSTKWGWSCDNGRQRGILLTVGKPPNLTDF